MARKAIYLKLSRYARPEDFFGIIAHIYHFADAAAGKLPAKIL
jgi:hypothetical protein